MVPSPLWRSSDVEIPKGPKQGWHSWADTASTDPNSWLKIIKCSCSLYSKCWCGCRETSGHSPHYFPVFKDLHSKRSVHRTPIYYAKTTRLEDEDHTYIKTVTEVLTKCLHPHLGRGTATGDALNLFSGLFAWRRSRRCAKTVPNVLKAWCLCKWLLTRKNARKSPSLALPQSTQNRGLRDSNLSYPNHVSFKYQR